MFLFHQATEQQIGHIRTNISKLIQTGQPDGFQLEVKLNLLERRWNKLAELMEDHKSLLNSAVQFYQLCEQVRISAQNYFSSIFFFAFLFYRSVLHRTSWNLAFVSVR